MPIDRDAAEEERFGSEVGHDDIGVDAAGPTREGAADPDAELVDTRRERQPRVQHVAGGHGARRAIPRKSHRGFRALGQPDLLAGLDRHNGQRRAVGEVAGPRELEGLREAHFDTDRDVVDAGRGAPEGRGKRVEGQVGSRQQPRDRPEFGWSVRIPILGVGWLAEIIGPVALPCPEASVATTSTWTRLTWARKVGCCDAAGTAAPTSSSTGRTREKATRLLRDVRSWGPASAGP